MGDTSKQFLIVLSAMKRIKHVNGIESSEGWEGVQSRKLNGVGWLGKSSEVVTFKLNPKLHKGGNCVQIWKRIHGVLP